MGETIYKFRYVILLVWVTAAGLAIGVIPPPESSGEEARSFLPEGSPFSRAMTEFAESFPDHANLSVAVVIFERSDGRLTPADQAAIRESARRILPPDGDDTLRGDLAGVRLVSPADYAPLPWQSGGLLPRNPMVSPITSNGQAAILRVYIPANYITTQSTHVVEHIRTVLREMQRGAGVSPARPAGILPARSGEDDSASSTDQANGTHSEGETPSPRVRTVLREMQRGEGVSPARPAGILPARSGEDDSASSTDPANGTHSEGETPSPRETLWPTGLSVAVTGSSGVGFDYAQSAKAGERRTIIATLLAVTCILLLVYRSPLAAAVPLVCITLAAVVATQLLNLGHHVGLNVGLAENIFVVVLIYGAGVDYSLLFISRYREYMQTDAQTRVAGGSPARPAGILPARSGKDDSASSTDQAHGTHNAGETPAPRSLTSRACGAALTATLPAIAAAAGINILGLFMLSFAQFGIFRTTGPAVAIALCVALAAALTLLPACVGVLGGRLFWPTRITPARRPPRTWTWLAGVVTRRPGAVLGLTLLALAAPAVLGARQEWAYDTLEALRPRDEDGVGNSARGAEIAKRHWPIGELAPVETLIKTSTPLTPAQWTTLTKTVRDSLLTLHLPEPRRAPATASSEPHKALVDIRSLPDPLGIGQPLPRLQTTTGPLSGLLSSGLIPGSRRLASIDADIQNTYLSTDRRATYMELVLATQPFTRPALAAVGDIHRQAQSAAQDALRTMNITADVEVFLMGPTAEMAATRDVTQRDFTLVATLVLGVIFAMILLLLRDAVLALWMLGSTVLSYFATLGLCSLVFVTLGGVTGLDWKLEIFLFVVMVAVGQDYNIFLATRLMQERASHPDIRVAARRAMTFTGPVISSCGLIMAATLGSLMVGGLALLVQLGFAMALGMLLDTFLVRPLLLPAFCCLTGRTGGRRTKNPLDESPKPP